MDNRHLASVAGTLLDAQVDRPRMAALDAEEDNIFDINTNTRYFKLMV